MRPAALLVAIGGLIVVSAVVMGWGIAQREGPLQTVPIEDPSPAISPTETDVERIGRQVAPAIAAPPFDTAQLERVEPRAPLSPLGAPEDPATRPPRETLLHRPVAIAAGLVEAEGHRISLQGIEIVPADEMCERDGRSWPCGVHARTAFRNYLRGRAIACTVPGTPSDEPTISRCTLANADPAEWLVEQGWARAVPGSDYQEAEQVAIETGRGIHGMPVGSN